MKSEVRSQKYASWGIVLYSQAQSMHDREESMVGSITVHTSGF
jgi:hypothetical protein